jgi:glycosyltransferase involved in cell wall biosynthesis
VKLSVIIPCLNAAKTLGKQLEALAAQDWEEPWEIIVADNGSVDGSVVVARQYMSRMPHLRAVDASDRRGPGHAANVGAAAARGEALAFCDADDEVAPGWLRAMGEALSKHDFVACRIDLEKLNPRWLRRRSPQERGVQQYSYPPYLPHAGGGTLGVKRRVHEAVGGFDESLPYLQDTDYCWRIQLAGTELRFVPDAVVHVRLRHTLPGIFRQALNWAEYNVVLYKRYQAHGMPRLRLREGLAAWRHLARSLLHLRTRADWARWTWELGWRMGRVRGSIRHHILAI